MLYNLSLARGEAYDFEGQAAAMAAGARDLRRPRSTTGRATRRSRASSRPATRSSGRARGSRRGTPSRRAAACPATAAPAAGGVLSRGRLAPLGALALGACFAWAWWRAGRRGGVRAVRPRLLRPLQALRRPAARTARRARGSSRKETGHRGARRADAGCAPRGAEAPRRPARVPRAARLARRSSGRPVRGAAILLSSSSGSPRRSWTTGVFDPFTLPPPDPDAPDGRSRARRSRLSSGCAPSGARGVSHGA